MNREKINWRNNPLIQAELNREDKDNIFVPPLEPNVAMDTLIEYLLGEGWIVSVPLNQKQVLYVAVKDILEKYSKRFRKELHQYAKGKDNGTI